MLRLPGGWSLGSMWRWRMKSDARSRGTKGKTGRKEVGVRIAVRRGGGVTDMMGDCQERRREARMEDGVQDGRGGERSGACHRRR